MTASRSSQARTALCRVRALWRAAALCAGLLALAGCKRTDEAGLRSLVEGWVYLGETVSFKATSQCAAAVFQLKGGRIASRMRVANSAREAAIVLKSQGQVALMAPRLTPDAALVQLINIDRAPGMRMRMAVLEGRACMDTQTEAAFASALVDPASVLMMDRVAGVIALLNPRDRLLIAAMGSE